MLSALGRQRRGRFPSPSPRWCYEKTSAGDQRGARTGDPAGVQFPRAALDDTTNKAAGTDTAKVRQCQPPDPQQDPERPAPSKDVYLIWRPGMESVSDSNRVGDRPGPSLANP
jgi:hypothetical protein